MSQPMTLQRRPWIAVVLSLICTGLGHIYVGRTARGVTLFLLSLLLTPLYILAAWLGPHTAILVLLLLATFAMLALYIFAAIDSGRAAGAQTSQAARDTQQTGLYVLFMLVGLSYPLGSTWLIRAASFEAFRCPTASMSPTILPGDRILVNKSAADISHLKRGDVVVHRNPEDRRQHFIKRLLALPGDTVEIRDNIVHLNGQPLGRDPLPADALHAGPSWPQGRFFHETVGGSRYAIVHTGRDALAQSAPTVVPPGTCFVLGDNRDASRDSRSYGFVPLGDLEGVLSYVFWPAGSWRRFGTL